MKKRVLITGASGFVGRHTVPLLLKGGYEVHAVHCGSASLDEEPRLFWHRCDLLNADEQRRLVKQVKPTHLLHLAWYATPGKYWTSVENIRWVKASLDLTINFMEQGGKRAVFAGTCAEYDWSYGYCSEGVTPTRPATLYGTCKNSLQDMVGHLSRQTGLSSAWGRVFFPYGPHEHIERLVPTVITSLLKGEVARCSHGRQIRDFIFVEDVASAFAALLESEVQGALNIGSGQPVTVKSVVEMIADRLVQRELVKFGAVAVSDDESQLLVANNKRLTKEVGWRPVYDLDSGLDRTIEWWKKELTMSGK